jgi:hypothetical protein
MQIALLWLVDNQDILQIAAHGVEAEPSAIIDRSTPFHRQALLANPAV